MGLFDSAKKKEIEQTILEKMIHSELINDVIYAIEHRPEYQWVNPAQNGDYDRRVVSVQPYWFLIEIQGAYEKGDEAHCMAVNFQKSGYSSLSAQSGISRSRMCYLFATALQKRLQSIMPNCDFTSVSNNRDYDQLGDDGIIVALGLLLDQGARATFSYHAPLPQSTRLF